jgi:hypothetical protein
MNRHSRKTLFFRVLDELEPQRSNARKRLLGLQLRRFLQIHERVFAKSRKFRPFDAISTVELA